MSSDEQDTGDDRARDGARSPGRRDPEQERRAAERARRIRERRAAERRAAAGTPAADGHDEPDDPEDADDRAADTGEAAEPAGRGSGRGAAAAVRERTAARAAERSRSRDPRYRRRRLVALLATAAVVLLGVSAAGWWALGRYGPPVATVRVDGTRQIPVRDVEDAAGDQTGVPLAAVDTDGVAARVSAIPGVAAVEVDRSWPDTLVVAVTERTPAALLDTPDGPKLVDVTGFVYRDAPPDVRLPRLQLPRVAPDDPATLAAVGVLQALPVPVRDQVQTLSLGGGGSTFELGLTEDRRVLWGPWSDTDQAAARARVLGPVLQREGAVYDVSSPSLVTVRQR
ncbi:cell division protein FtsQ/DivIB [Pseudonocardia sp. ICBG162]|uniref:cell division protein FtsQ/DivIB n=1 Tax=Pseudonocardia sp. ICBG162 TaxID=2846761 RepID=UPI001CF66439|nr:FtsQ-type POTRA domain-containing protein [Pseudonocardia sp. ICBG162]